MEGDAGTSFGGGIGLVRAADVGRRRLGEQGGGLGDLAYEIDESAGTAELQAPRTVIGISWSYPVM